MLLMTGCGPTYPKCENDDHCSEKGEYCVNNLCQQCRDNSHCEGPGKECSAGKCQFRAGYCDDARACPGNGKCRSNECGPQCLDNAECTNEEFCSGGGCVARPACGPNALTAECPDGKECVGGACQQKLAQCGGDSVQFDFDRSNVKRGERDKIKAIAACMQDPNAANLQVAGHADERGTSEYNLALGERRALAVRKFLEALGVQAGKLSTISYGKERPVDPGHNESAWRKNRRAEFNPQ